ncbi:MAG: hypothetical protein ACP5RS_01830 [Thermoplasmata archaeon]
MENEEIYFVCKVCGQIAFFNQTLEADFCIEHGFDTLVPVKTTP